MSSEDPALAGVTQFQAAGQAGRTHSGYSLSLEGLLAALSLEAPVVTSLVPLGLRMLRKANPPHGLGVQAQHLWSRKSRREVVMLTFQHKCLLFLYKLGHCTQPTCTFLSDRAFGMDSSFKIDTAHHLPSSLFMLLAAEMQYENKNLNACLPCFQIL